MSIQHKTIDTFEQGVFTVKQIAQEESVVIFNNGADEGYHNYTDFWWTNMQCPLAYKYLDLDSMYPARYFSGFELKDGVNVLYQKMQAVYANVFGKNFQSILELGTGGGEITLQFQKHNLDYVGVEGTSAGVAKLIEFGLDPDRIIHSNLKFMQQLDRKFDLVMCTEVAEHLEPTFASKIVSNCTSHGNAVWFSAPNPGNGQMGHYHHITAMPIEAWDNLFAQFGFTYHIELSGMPHDRGNRLYFNQEAANSLTK